MAGVTLLAVANGAGDVITALVASGTSDGISYNIGSLYGAGLFCMTFIMSKTIDSSSTNIKINKNTIYRDIGMYIIATITTIIFAITEKLTVATSLIFLGLYLTLVLIVYIQDRVNP